MYPADPLGDIAGGIDTFIRGVLRYAPPDIEMTVVGATTSPSERPIGEWSHGLLGGQEVKLFPLVELDPAGHRPVVPVSLRFTMSLRRHRASITADVLEFHVVECCLALLGDLRPKNLVIHQDMSVLRSAVSDIRWRHMPWLYFQLERRLLPAIDSVFCVRSDAIENYRARYPALADRFRFTPTYVDDQVFSRATDDERGRAREVLRREFDLQEDDDVLITVGRLSGQKNPLLMLDAFRILARDNPKARLLFVGDGQLRNKVTAQAAKLGLEDRVTIAGIRGAETVSEYLKGSDVFVLSSDYEGMPMSVLEALACGLPVAATDVGEVNRVVLPGINGHLVNPDAPEQLADAIENCLRNRQEYRGAPCWEAVREYMPDVVLQPIYDNYRRLAASREL